MKLDITFTPKTLSSEEFLAIRKNKFELHNLEMKLESLDAKGDTFSGQGVIQQTLEGQIHFTLYNKEHSKSVLEKILVSQLMLDDYRLLAIDSKGREWICNRTKPYPSGTNCTGSIYELIYKSGNQTGEINFVYLEIFYEAKLPYNAYTDAGPDTNLNALSFTAYNLNFFLQKKGNILYVHAQTINGNLVDHVETRIMESLQFVLAQPLLWFLMIKSTNNGITTSIRRNKLNPPKYHTQPPIAINHITNSSIRWFCQLFDLYLTYVIKNADGEKYHRLSGKMRSICLASNATVETQSVILGVAVEGILKSVPLSLPPSLSNEEQKWVKTATDYFSNWQGPEKLTNRIEGLLRQLNQLSVSHKLDELVKLGAISSKQQKAWGKLRNKYAHGGLLDSTHPEEWLDLSYTVLELFYHLVFFTIGYEGYYTDYSTRGWSPEYYTVKPPSENVS